jgi:hypothetical protein
LKVRHDGVVVSELRLFRLGSRSRAAMHRAGGRVRRLGITPWEAASWSKTIVTTLGRRV